MQFPHLSGTLILHLHGLLQIQNLPGDDPRLTVLGILRLTGSLHQQQLCLIPLCLRILCPGIERCPVIIDQSTGSLPHDPGKDLIHTVCHLRSAAEISGQIDPHPVPGLAIGAILL